MADWDRQLREWAEQYEAMACRLDAQTVTETSADRTVQVTVSSRGMLMNLSLTEAAGAKGMAELSARIMKTLRRAQARIPELLARTMAETVGSEGETANRLLAEARQMFPADTEEPAPELWRELRLDADEDERQQPSPRRARRPARRPTGDDDEFTGFEAL